MTTQAAPVGFRGSLSETPLPQVLRRIFLEGLKGTLSLVHGDETRHLFFEKGELRTATSSREGQRIGAFLKRRGCITDTDLNWALDTVARQGRARLGKILVERGLVSRTVLDAEMRRLVEEIVFSTFAWDSGEYKYQASAGVLDPDVALSLSTAAIIVEGIRRLPESEMFRERLGEGHRVPILATDPMSRYQYLPLTPQEAYLLSRIDGILDVDSLLKIAGASRGATAKILYGLVSCGIVEWKQRGGGAAGERPRRVPRSQRRSLGAARRALARPRRARQEHLPPHRLADALRAARNSARRASREGLGGLLRAEPPLPSGPPAPRGPRQVRKGAQRRLRADARGVRDAVGRRQARALRPEPRCGAAVASR